MLSRHNHYTPQDYLRNWSPDGVRVNARRLLVPVPQYPPWELRAIRGVAARNDLYTSVASGEDSDAFERWVNRFVEAPASEALKKARNDLPLTEDDRARLALYAAALHVRNPVNYVEQAERWAKEMPAVLHGVLERLQSDLEKAKRENRKITRAAMAAESDRLPLHVRLEKDDPTSDLVSVHAEVTVGRELWLHGARHLIESTALVLKDHRWSILRPAPGSEWFTSDNPFVRLNYYGDWNYDLRGGWGKPKTDLLLPLSPTLLMHTSVGATEARDATLDAEMTLAFQRFIAENAHRWIVARGRPLRAEWFRQRVVDLSQFRSEEDAWKRWHAEQRAAERSSWSTERAS